MGDYPKEGYFGLPESLFNAIVAFLQTTATCPGTGTAGPEVAAALSVLISLAQAEHAAAVSTVEVRTIDLIFRAIEIKTEFDKLAALSGTPLATQLGTLKGKLDGLKDFLNGK